MGVFKEEAHIFERIMKNQTRIFNDAADIGYPYNTENVPTEVTAVFKTIAQFKSIDKRSGRKHPFVRNREDWGDGVSVDVIIFWEEDEGYYFGTKYSISFSKTWRSFSKIDKASNAFISIYAERFKEKI